MSNPHVLTVAFCAIGALMSIPADASVYTRLMHNSQCYDVVPGFGLEEGAGNYIVELSTSQLICPLIDDANGPKADINAFGVDGYFCDTNPAHTFMLPCVKYYGTAGGRCGTTTSYGGPVGIGRMSNTTNPAPWSTNPADFGYLFVSIGASGCQSTFFGFWVSIPIVE